MADWDVERRFRVTEVALAIMWVRRLCEALSWMEQEDANSPSYLVLCICLPDIFFHGLSDVSMVCLLFQAKLIPKMTHSVARLLNYSPPAVVIRLLATNGLIAYVTSWVLYLAGASSDPRLLLPAWICISAVSPDLLSLYCSFP